MRLLQSPLREFTFSYRVWLFQKCTEGCVLNVNSTFGNNRHGSISVSSAESVNVVYINQMFNICTIYVKTYSLLLTHMLNCTLANENSCKKSSLNIRKLNNLKQAL